MYLGPQVTDLCLFLLKEHRAGRLGPTAFEWYTIALGPAADRKLFQVLQPENTRRLLVLILDNERLLF